MASAVRIIGMDDLDKAFKQMRKEVLKELRPTLRKAGEFVRAEWQGQFSRYDARSAAGYKVRVRQRGVAVEQSLPRVTGLRGDYGALQMRVGSAALKSQEKAVTEQIDQMIDTASSGAGLT
jgi:hypothetical protein